MPKRYRVAIAGCHRMLERNLANHNWAAAFATDPRAEIVAVFDKGEDTRRAFISGWGPLPAFADYSAMLKEMQPDVVCVATRQTMHADQIEEAAAVGAKGILCDKPLATSMAEVDRIVAACERHGVKFAFGTERRWSPFYRALQRMLADGAVGEVRAVSAFGLRNYVFHGCHWFDRVAAFAGDAEIAWVAGWIDPLPDEPSDSRRHLDPAGSCHVHFSNGVDAFVTQANYTAGFDVGFDIVGTTGRLVILSDGAVAQHWSLSDDGQTPVLHEVPSPPSVPIWPLVVKDLLDAIDDERPTLGDVHCARRATEIGFAAHQSHREGGRRIRPIEIDRELRIPSLPWGNE